MKAKGVAYIVGAVVIGVFVLANWTLFAMAVELNLLIARVQTPLIVLILLVGGMILLSDLAVHALSQRAWSRERRTLRKELEVTRLRAEPEEQSRAAALRVTMERELAAIRAQLDQVIAAQSALLGRAPIVRGTEPDLISPRVGPDRGRH